MPSRKEKEEEPQEFKVVDRRLFTSEGDLRGNLPPEPPPPEPPPQSAASKSQPQAPLPAAAPAAEGQPAASSETGTAAGHPPGQGPVRFEHLIMSLVTSAMYQLGMAARPGEVPPPADLPAARETIDLLAMLQEKTKGNLTPEEENLLSGSLQELRLAFVEITRMAGRIR